ncbi:MAG TPA: hypothetical protein VGM37_16955 [Armatimonadota bacterium]
MLARLLLPSAALWLALVSPAHAWEEWANRVIGFSSEYGTTEFGSVQALDLPDTASYGDSPLAWTPANMSGTQEFLTLGFREPLHADGAIIVESSGNGYVTSIEALDTGGVYHTVWAGTDPTQPDSILSFHPTWAATSYLAQGLRIRVDTNHSAGWEEIDAVKMTGAPADTLQWASKVIAVSSEYSSPPEPFSSIQALGEPNAVKYGDNGNAWTPAENGGSQEYITLGFAAPVTASGAVIRESNGNGFVTRIDALDTGGAYHQVWSGADTTPPGAIGWFAPTWTPTTYAVQGLRITVDTGHDSAWEEIDAVYLRGQATGASAPAIANISPTNVFREGPDLVLTVNGTNLLSTTVVRLNGSDRPTTWVSGTQLRAAIAAADIASPGPLSITAYTPPPGGGTSNSAAFTVSPDLVQWASMALGSSSSFNPAGPYSPAQALGPPDILAYGDSSNAWTVERQNSGLQYLTLGYNRLVLADGLTVRETNATGFVKAVDVLDTDGAYHTIWTGSDPSAPGAIAEFSFEFTQTAYVVRGIRVWVDTGRSPADWPEIDAVQLKGIPIAVPVPSITGFGRSPLLKGGLACTLVVNGSGFTPTSVLRWNGADRPTTFVKTTQLLASLSAADVAAAAAISVTVATPPPGGGVSPAAALSVGPAVWGDANGDSSLTVADARESLRIAAGLVKRSASSAGDVAPEYPQSAIGYGDGRLDVLDAIRILRRALTGS